MKTVTVYANPVTKVGFPEEAEVLEVIRDQGRLQYCKVKMIETGKICKVLINQNNETF